MPAALQNLSPRPPPRSGEGAISVPSFFVGEASHSWARGRARIAPSPLRGGGRGERLLRASPTQHRLRDSSESDFAAPRVPSGKLYLSGDEATGNERGS